MAPQRWATGWWRPLVGALRPLRWGGGALHRCGSSSVLISNMFSAASIGGCRPRIDRPFVTSAADPESCWEIKTRTQRCLFIYPSVPSASCRAAAEDPSPQPEGDFSTVLAIVRGSGSRTERVVDIFFKRDF